MSRAVKTNGAVATTRGRAEHLGPERGRPLILDAAFELFIERGFEGTSMDAIAEAAGVTKPVVYACFPGKAVLFEALLRRHEERILGEITAALASVSDPRDAERTLTEGFTAFLRAVAASPAAYRRVFLGEGGVSAEVARRIRRGRAQQVDAVSAPARTWLGAASDAAENELDAQARLIGEVVVSLAEAGARLLLDDPDSWTPDGLGATLGRLPVRGEADLRPPN